MIAFFLSLVMVPRVKKSPEFVPWSSPSEINQKRKREKENYDWSRKMWVGENF